MFRKSLVFEKNRDSNWILFTFNLRDNSSHRVFLLHRLVRVLYKIVIVHCVIFSLMSEIALQVRHHHFQVNLFLGPCIDAIDDKSKTKIVDGRLIVAVSIPGLFPETVKDCSNV